MSSSNSTSSPDQTPASTPASTPAPSTAASRHADGHTRYLARKFSKLARGLVLSYYGDEGSTDAFHSYSLKFDPATPLTVESFQAAAGLKEAVRLQERSADEFFAAMQDPDNVGEEAVGQYAKLEAAMRRDLTDLKVFLDANEETVKGKVYILGRSSTGSLAGLQASRIWT